MNAAQHLRATTLVCVAFALITTVSAQTGTRQAHRPATRGGHKVVTVVIKDLKYKPATVSVHAGDTVQWKNEDDVPHTATAEKTASISGFDSGTVNPGASWKYVATKRGTYKYTCTFHPNMVGKLIVN